MNNSKSGGTFLILSGIFILGIFIYVCTLNILPNNSSDSYFSKDDDGLYAIINDITFDDNKLNIYTSDNDVEICVKQTKSVPRNNSVCWKEVNDKKISFSVYVGKTYFIWLKDSNNNISEYIEYNTNTREIVN